MALGCFNVDRPEGWMCFCQVMDVIAALSISRTCIAGAWRGPSSPRTFAAGALGWFSTCRTCVTAAFGGSSSCSNLKTFVVGSLASSSISDSRASNIGNFSASSRGRFSGHLFWMGVSFVVGASLRWIGVGMFTFEFGLSEEKKPLVIASRLQRKDQHTKRKSCRCCRRCTVQK